MQRVQVESLFGKLRSHKPPDQKKQNIKQKQYCVCVRFFRFQLSINGHVRGFHVLATVNSAAMNSGVHVPLQIIVFSGYTLRNKTAGSYTNSTDF